MRLATLLALLLTGCNPLPARARPARGGTLVYIDDADAGERCYAWSGFGAISCVRVAP